MVKNKKLSGSSRPKGPARRARVNLADAFVPQAGHNASKPAQFSLRDAALNTERHHGEWSSDRRLRHNRVAFVLSAAAEPQQSPDEQDSPSHVYGDITRSSDAFAQMNLQPADTDVTSSSDTDAEVEHQDGTSADACIESATLPFVVDVVGSKSTLCMSVPPPVIRSISPSPSNSSDEVVFTGRSIGRTVVDPPSHLPNTAARLTASTQSIPAWDTAPVPWVPRSQPGVGWIATGSRRHRKRGRKRKNWQEDEDGNDAEEDEAVADYLDNLRGQDDAVLEQSNGSATFGQRTLSLGDGNERIDDSDSSMSAVPTQRKGSGFGQDGWEPSLLRDFDELSTSQELTGVVEHILSKRERKQGLQYLVVYKGHTVDEARWIPNASLTADNDVGVIQAFEEALIGQVVESSDSEGDSSSEDDESSSDEDEDRWKDEEDLRQRKIERMTDEKIARILAKQEQLGMGSADVLLFDDDDEEDDSCYARGESGFNVPLRLSHRRSQRSGRAKGEYPSASLMADVLEQDPYNGFDIMDFDRPSLRKKPKGRRGELPFELSDEELTKHLQNTWEADRKKKRVKKQEREELRAQGLLGKKNKFKPNLNLKYNEGMTLAQIKEELQWFLDSSHASYALPPMAARERHVVHEIANAFNVKSKSKGEGDARFTTLIRTSRTLDFDDRVFTRMEKRLLQRFLPRMDKPKRRTAVGSGRTGGGANNAAVVYRNGDVVGGGAPEISAENRGRTMLEKMGWSTGTALGALNNKGILQPVTHVVKTNKAGLG